MVLDKINVDATISKNSNTAAVAAVARSADGTFVGVSAMVMKGVMDTEMSKTLARGKASH